MRRGRVSMLRRERRDIVVRRRRYMRAMRGVDEGGVTAFGITIPGG
jgi:hypothetical protein